MTKIRSASITVANLWAIIITVESLKLDLNFYYIRLSVSKSTFAVASSRTNIFVLSNIALARQINYFYPTEKRLFDSETTVSSF